jgi:hypothetical protein
VGSTGNAPKHGEEVHGRRVEVSQTMHTHVSKCKNDKIKEKKERKNKKFLHSKGNNQQSEEPMGKNIFKLYI